MEIQNKNKCTQNEKQLQIKNTGVTGMSSLFEIDKDFDIVRGFGIDMLHELLLGVCGRFLQIIFHKMIKMKNKKDYDIYPQNCQTNLSATEIERRVSIISKYLISGGMSKPKLITKYLKHFKGIK